MLLRGVDSQIIIIRDFALMLVQHADIQKLLSSQINIDLVYSIFQRPGQLCVWLVKLAMVCEVACDKVCTHQAQNRAPAEPKAPVAAVYTWNSHHR